MKILRVTSDLYPYSLGGLGIHTHELSKEIIKMGHEVTVFTCEQQYKVYHSFVDGYEVFRFKPLVNLIGNSLAPSMLIPLLKTVDSYDIVHAHSHLFFSTNIAAFVRKLKNTPLIVTNHGFVSQTAPMKLQNIILPIIAKWTYINADAIICYTIEMKKEMENWGIPTDNVRIIHNGINIDLFQPSSTIEKEYDIIWVGRYVPGKNIELLIQSFYELKKEFKNLKILMIGDGIIKKSIERKIIEMDLVKNIISIDKIPNNDLPEYYQKSKVFVLSSLEEGVPRTMLEAMACGLPIVCSRLPQLEKIVEGCGITVSKEDLQGFIKAIAKILSDSQLAEKLGKNAHTNVCKNYSWNDTVKKTLLLYEEMNN